MSIAVVRPETPIIQVGQVIPIICESHIITRKRSDKHDNNDDAKTNHNNIQNMRVIIIVAKKC